MYNYFYLAGTFSVQTYKILYLMQYAHPDLETHVAPYRQTGQLVSWDLESTFLHLQPYI